MFLFFSNQIVLARLVYFDFVLASEWNGVLDIVACRWDLNSSLVRCKNN